MKTAYLAALAVIAGCNPTTEDPRPSAPARTPAEVAPVAANESLPSGWHRVDLRTLTPPLAVSAAIPNGRRVKMHGSTCRDRDGLLFATVEADVELDDGSTVSISPCQTMGMALTTLAAAKAAYAKAGQVKVGTTEEAPTGAWVLTLADHSNFTVGWVPAARVMCRTQGTKSSDDVRRICLGLRPTGSGFVAAPDPALTFPDESDPAARDVLASLQRALAHDDHDGFLALVDAHVEFRGSTDLHSRTALRIAAEGFSLESFLGFAKCGPTRYEREPGAECQLRSGRRGDVIGVTVQVSPTSKWTSFELAKTPAGWRIVRINVGTTS